MSLIFISFGFPNRDLETAALDSDVVIVAEIVMGNLSFGQFRSNWKSASNEQISYLNIAFVFVFFNL